MAPDTGERAALEEDRGTDTGSVVHGKTLNIEDHGSGFGHDRIRPFGI